MATRKSDRSNAPEKGSTPFIHAKIDRIIDYENSHVRAYASANIGGAFAIHGIKIIDSPKGLFVAMPQNSYTNAKGEIAYRDIFHAVTANARSSLNSQVLEAYERELTQSQNSMENEDASENEAESENSDMSQKM